MIKILIIVSTLFLLFKLNHWSENQKYELTSRFPQQKAVSEYQKSFFDPEGFHNK